MEEQDELTKEFLIESTENLTQLDQDFVELEQRPDDKDLLSSVFRTTHTIKGTCGFLGFSTLEAIAHGAESILSQLREGDRILTPALTTLLLEAFDVIREILAVIETTERESSEQYIDLRERLKAACDGNEEPVSSATGAAGDESAAELSESDGGVETPEVSAPPPAASSAVDRKQARPAAPAAKSLLADSNIRVRVDLLDNLMNLVGELVLARNQILQFSESQHDTNVTAASQRLNLITTELQANVMKTRMQPIRLVWNNFPRVVRDLGQSVGKNIELQMEGAETELDKTIIEAIKDPLTHLVRNSCDHGIESTAVRTGAGKPGKGVVLLRAYHEGGQVNIEISDDGGGIDPEKLKSKALSKGLFRAEELERMGEREILNLIFMAGFSTAEKVTNVSGRGVGMDVVRANIEKIGGSVDIQSQLGQGTTIKIKIPLTLAIIPALIVRCGTERFAIPQVSLLELVRIGVGRGQQIESISGAPVYRLRGKLLPLVYLGEILGLKNDEDQAQEPSVNIVILQTDDKTFGLVVDSVSDTAEIVVKPLSKLLKGLNWYAGATIMGDGYVALILDVMGVALRGQIMGIGHSHAHVAPDESVSEISDRQTVLIFRSGSDRRLAVPLSVVDRLEEFPLERIESSGGRKVVQYRDRILPLLALNEVLGSGQADATDSEKVQVVVFSEGERQVGAIVDEVLDIVEDNVGVRGRSSRSGIVGSAVIDGGVTDFVDLRYLISQVDEGWVADGGRVTRVMVAEGSRFSRGVLRNYLEMAGCEVLEAADSAGVLKILRLHRVDVLLASLDLPGMDVYELMRQVRTDLGLYELRMIALSRESKDRSSPAAEDDPFDDYQDELDRESMLQSVTQLTRAIESRQEARVEVLTT
jgi:two-component system chemotaxis sensor kinase CheA